MDELSTQGIASNLEVKGGVWLYYVIKINANAYIIIRHSLADWFHISIGSIRPSYMYAISLCVNNMYDDSKHHLPFYEFIPIAKINTVLVCT